MSLGQVMDKQIIQPSQSNHGQGGAIAQLQVVSDHLHTQCAKKTSNDILQDVAINKMAPPEKGHWTVKAAVHPHPAKADPLLKSKAPKPAFINAEQNSVFGFNSRAPPQMSRWKWGMLKVDYPQSSPGLVRPLFVDPGPRPQVQVQQTPDSDPSKVGDTRNQHLYVSCLYKCQEQQNVAFENFQKIWWRNGLENIVLDLQNIIIVSPALPCAPCMISLVMQPYQEGECNAHGTSCLPMLPRDLKVPACKNQ